MTIDKKINQILQTYPSLHNNLNHYAETGFQSYAKMIEFDLNLIKQHYGNDYYNQFNHIYEGIQELYR